MPSINKHCFLFPLSFFAAAVLYLLVFEFSIVIVNRVKELGPFIDLCPEVMNVVLARDSSKFGIKVIIDCLNNV